MRPHEPISLQKHGRNQTTTKNKFLIAMLERRKERLEKQLITQEPGTLCDGFRRASPGRIDYREKTGRDRARRQMSGKSGKAGGVCGRNENNVRAGLWKKAIGLARQWGHETFHPQLTGVIICALGGFVNRPKKRRHAGGLPRAVSSPGLNDRRPSRRAAEPGARRALPWNRPRL
jgi:hypothetical protein